MTLRLWLRDTVRMAVRPLDTPASTRRPVTSPLRPELWLLDPGVAHLNHGSYGAVPIPVMQAQRAALEAIERSPERFYRTDLHRALPLVRQRTAEFLSVDPDGLVLTQNATEAVQAVLASLRLTAGAQILFTDHVYPWVKAAIERACRDSGAVPRCVPLPSPSKPSPSGFAAELTRTLKDALNQRTALLVIDQITSASALELPVAAVCAELGARVPILIDAAHAPGLIDDPVPPGASFWVGNLHKWAFAARTAAALVVAPGWRQRVRPLVASAGAALGFPDSFNYLGTQDPTAYLALPTALAFPAEHLDMTFEQLRQRNAAVLDAGMQRVADALSVPPPVSNGLPIRTLSLERPGDEAAAWELGDRLRNAGVEMAIISLQRQLHARFSVQAYVGLSDFDCAAAALQS